MKRTLATIAIAAAATLGLAPPAQAATSPASPSWATSAALNQASDPWACMGYALAGLLSAGPGAPRKTSDAFADRLYHAARYYDERPGTNYNGTSVDGVMLAAKHYGYITGYTEYDTLAGIDAALATGPVMIVIVWDTGMNHPDRYHVIHPAGTAAPRHALYVTARDSRGVYTLRNSMGSAWGLSGSAYIHGADLVRAFAGTIAAASVTKTAKALS